LFVQNDLAEKEDDSATVAAFKTSVSESLRERFAMTSDDTARHPFVVATVLDPAVKAMMDFPESLRAAAYGHVRSLVSDANAGTSIEEGDETPATNPHPNAPSRMSAQPHSASFHVAATRPRQRRRPSLIGIWAQRQHLNAIS